MKFSQDIGKLAPHLDFISTHIYPKRDKLHESEAFISANQSSKPLVLTETGQLASSIQDLRQFLENTDPQVDGVIAHYHGKTLEELAVSPDIPDALHKQLIELMMTLEPENHE